MPWKECSKVDERGEFVSLAKVEGAKVTGLCERFGIVGRLDISGCDDLVARRAWLIDRGVPQHSPTRTARKMEQAVLGVRDPASGLGGRKIAVRLKDTGHQGVPAASTITEILRRHGRLR